MKTKTLASRAAPGQAETDRQTGDARLLDILDIAPDAIIAIDESQRIVLFNKSAEQMFAYSAEEALGQPLGLLIPERFVEAHRQHVLAFKSVPEMARRMGERQEIIGRRKDGSEFPAEASISKSSRDGRITFTAIVRDITERKRAEAALRESEEKFRHAFEYAAFGMALVSTGGSFLQVNQSLCRMLGYSAPELWQKTFQELTYPDDLEVGLELFRDLMAGKQDYGWLEKRYVHKDGRVIWTRLRAYPNNPLCQSG